MAQRGWITKQERKKGVVWVFHWYVTKPQTGKKAEHTAVIGALADFPSEKEAWREVDRRHLNQGTDVKTVQGLLRHSNVTTTLGLYAHRVNASMMAAQDAMMQALETGSQTVQ